MDNRVGQLDFVWRDAPARATVREVAPGLNWVRLPLPFRLDHINIWLIEEADGWTVIDTGCRTDEILEIWQILESGPMRRLPIRRVVATHGHVDHIGLAGWLVDRHGAEFVGTFGEWNWARVVHIQDVPNAARTHQAYLVRNGVDAATAEKMVESRRGVIGLATPLPGALVEIRDRGMIVLGGRTWEVIVTPGHAFEHASFLDRASGVLIAGDHLLPKISPVIAVYETTPKGDPLGDYLESFARFSDIAADVLVLPSHGLPYRGIHDRIAQLQDHHRKRLEATLDHLSAPMTGLELTRAMFPHVEGLESTGFALAETLAHVNYLQQRGEVGAIEAPGACVTYARKQPV